MALYRLHVTLDSVDPQVWRAFTIDASRSLRDLHLALQVIMGWRESHLHIFSDTDPYAPPAGIRERRWGEADRDLAVEPEELATIADAFAEGGPIWYEYDLGDGWQHRIDLIESVEVPSSIGPPVRDVEGANRAPYEDAGGPSGYVQKLAIAADPGHADYAFIAGWIRSTVGPFSSTDPAFFDPLAVQSELNLLFNADSSGAHPYDMSGLVKADEHRSPGDLHLESALVDLASNLPVPIRTELRQHLHRAGVLEPREIDAETAERLIRPYLWLLNVVGSEGLLLTKAGRLPPATVVAAMTELGWADNWIGRINREEQTLPALLLRETALRMGLVRNLKGRLVLGADAKKALRDPRRVLDVVVHRALRGLPDYARMAAVLHLLAIADGTPGTDQWRHVSFGMGVLGWQPSDRYERDFSPHEVDQLIQPIHEVLRVLSWHRRSTPGDQPEDPDLRLIAGVMLRG